MFIYFLAVPINKPINLDFFRSPSASSPTANRRKFITGTFHCWRKCTAKSHRAATAKSTRKTCQSFVITISTWPTWLTSKTFQPGRIRRVGMRMTPSTGHHRITYSMPSIPSTIKTTTSDLKCRRRNRRPTSMRRQRSSRKHKNTSQAMASRRASTSWRTARVRNRSIISPNEVREKLLFFLHTEKSLLFKKIFQEKKKHRVTGRLSTDEWLCLAIEAISSHKL